MSTCRICGKEITSNEVNISIETGTDEKKFQFCQNCYKIIADEINRLESKNRRKLVKKNNNKDTKAKPETVREKIEKYGLDNLKAKLCEGVNREELAKEIDITKQSLNKIVLEIRREDEELALKIDDAYNKNTAIRKIEEYGIDKIKQEILDGYTRKDIAEKIGISKQIIYKIIDDLKLSDANFKSELELRKLKNKRYKRETKKSKNESGNKLNDNIETEYRLVKDNTKTSSSKLITKKKQKETTEFLDTAVNKERKGLEEKVILSNQICLTCGYRDRSCNMCGYQIITLKTRSGAKGACNHYINMEKLK